MIWLRNFRVSYKVIQKRRRVSVLNKFYGRKTAARNAFTKNHQSTAKELSIQMYNYIPHFGMNVSRMFPFVSKTVTSVPVRVCLNAIDDKMSLETDVRNTLFELQPFSSLMHRRRKLSKVEILRMCLNYS